MNKEIVEYVNSKRITVIAVFDDKTSKKIKNLSKDNYCKVPAMVQNRFEKDTLPYHLSLFEINYQDVEKLKFINEINFVKNIKVLSIDMNKSKKGGYGIYLSVESDKLSECRKTLMDDLNISTNQFYTNYKGHITIASFEAIDDAQKEYETCKKKFKPFTANIKSIQVHEIYPSTLIKNIEIL